MANVRGRRGSQPAEESTHRRIQDVLGQARAALRNSQQFRPIKHDDNLSTRLVFQQQHQEPDYWTTVAEAKAKADKEQTKLQEAKKAVTSQYQSDYGGSVVDEDETLLGSHPPPESPSRKNPPNEFRPSQDVRRSSLLSHMSISSSLSMDTNDLKVTDTGSALSATDSDISVSLAGGKISRKQLKMKESLENVSIRSKKAPSSASKSQTSEKVGGKAAKGVKSKPPSGKKSPAELFEMERNVPRSFVMNEDGKDPDWFDKMLSEGSGRVSTDTLSSAKSIRERKPTPPREPVTPRRPTFADFTDPEYTADWISDAASVADMPKTESEMELVEDTVSFDQVVDEEDDINTASMVKTASELEESGVLQEIAENLQEVLEISDKPKNHELIEMSAEEQSYAVEYDEALQNKSDPLQSIFKEDIESVVQEPSSSTKDSTFKNETQVTADDQDSTTLGVGGKGTEPDSEGEQYDSTFISLKTSTISKSQTVSKSATGGNKKLSKKSKTKSSKSSTTASSGEATKSKTKGSSLSVSTKSSSGPIAKSKSGSLSVSKSPSSSSTRTRRGSVLPPQHALDPPKTRHQKNIQTILEKEVYEKELKKVRSENAKDEKEKARLRKVAKESLNQNRMKTYKDPDYTEILLPELFKYKSVSGLQAAKARKPVGPQPEVNYGAPYFNMNGALSTSDYGVATLAAQVNSLDIPDLVREVLASNERMYRMTVEASEEMARSYKEKMRAQSSRQNNRRR